MNDEFIIASNLLQTKLIALADRNTNYWTIFCRKVNTGKVFIANYSDGDRFKIRRVRRTRMILKSEQIEILSLVCVHLRMKRNQSQFVIIRLCAVELFELGRNGWKANCTHMHGQDVRMCPFQTFHFLSIHKRCLVRQKKDQHLATREDRQRRKRKV